MKNFLSGVLLTLIFSSVTNYTWLKSEIGSDIYKAAKFLKFNILDGGYLLNPIVGNCADKMGKNGRGWTFNMADYYGCDRFQRLLNWNFKQADLNSPRF